MFLKALRAAQHMPAGRMWPAGRGLRITELDYIVSIWRSGKVSKYIDARRHLPCKLTKLKYLECVAKCGCCKIDVSPAVSNAIHG